MRAGDIAAFPAADGNGHHLVNRADADCVFVAIGAGDRAAGGCYPDIDMRITADGYVRKDGTAYEAARLK